MNVKRSLVHLLMAIGIVGVSGCDDSPTSPSPIVSPPRTAYSLAAGDYKLTIFVSASAATACREPTPVPDTAAIPVIVNKVDQEWLIRPTPEADLGFVAILREIGPGALDGPAGGQARDPGAGIVVSVSSLPEAPGFTPVGPSKFLGFMQGQDHVEGIVTADVRFAQGSARRTCGAFSWRMHRR